MPSLVKTAEHTAISSFAIGQIAIVPTKQAAWLDDSPTQINPANRLLKIIMKYLLQASVLSILRLRTSRTDENQLCSVKNHERAHRSSAEV